MPSSIVSVSQAADLVRRDRQTLYNHRKQGKLSFVKRDDNSYGVDTAELERVYGKLYATPAEVEEYKSSAVDQSASAQITELKHQLELQEMEMEVKLATERADVWKEKAEKAIDSVKLLEDQSANKAQQQKQAEAEWKQAIADRQIQIDQARHEADEMRRMGEDRVISIQEEKAKAIDAWKSRGFFARLMNKSPVDA